MQIEGVVALRTADPPVAGHVLDDPDVFGFQPFGYDGRTDGLGRSDFGVPSFDRPEQMEQAVFDVVIPVFAEEEPLIDNRIDLVGLAARPASSPSKNRITSLSRFRPLIARS